MKSCIVWAQTRLITFCSETPFVPEDSVCVYKQKWQQIGLSVKLTQTTADKNVLGARRPSLCQLAHHNGLLCESAGNEAEGASKLFQMISL